MALLGYPVRLDGPRVVLRDFEAGDLEETMAIVGDPEVTATLSFNTRTREEQATRLAADIARAQSVPRPDYYLAVVEKETDSLIGFSRLGLGQGGEGSGEVGYAIRKDHWRQGYASEAVSILLAFAFDTLGLQRVQAACGPLNTPSQTVLSKRGFHYERRINDHVFTNGAWRDSLVFAISKEGWRP